MSSLAHTQRKSVTPMATAKWKVVALNARRNGLEKKDLIDREYTKHHIEACFMNCRQRHVPDLDEVLSMIDDVPSEIISEFARRTDETD